MDKLEEVMRNTYDLFSEFDECGLKKDFIRKLKKLPLIFSIRKGGSEEFWINELSDPDSDIHRLSLIYGALRHIINKALADSERFNKDFCYYLRRVIEQDHIENALLMSEDTSLKKRSDENEGVRNINLGGQQWSAGRKIYFTYPLVSFLAALILLLVATYLEGGIISVTVLDIFLKIAAIVFSILSVIGILDGLFLDSYIGFSFARWLHLLDRYRLQDLRYVEDAKGKIEKGAETIQIALTLISLVLT